MRLIRSISICDYDCGLFSASSTLDLFHVNRSSRLARAARCATTRSQRLDTLVNVDYKTSPSSSAQLIVSRRLSDTVGRSSRYWRSRMVVSASMPRLVARLRLSRVLASPVTLAGWIHQSWSLLAEGTGKVKGYRQPDHEVG